MQLPLPLPLPPPPTPVASPLTPPRLDAPKLPTHPSRPNPNAPACTARTPNPPTAPPSPHTDTSATSTSASALIRLHFIMSVDRPPGRPADRASPGALPCAGKCRSLLRFRDVVARREVEWSAHARARQARRAHRDGSGSVRVGGSADDVTFFQALTKLRFRALALCIVKNVRGLPSTGCSSAPSFASGTMILPSLASLARAPRCTRSRGS